MSKVPCFILLSPKGAYLSKRSLDDLAQVFLNKASGDEAALQRLIDTTDVPDEVLGFHAQQAVEKLIKAVLAYSQSPPPRSHDIAYLITLVEDVGVPAPPNVYELEALNPWAIEFRYEDSFGEVFDRAAATILVAKVRSWAEEILTPKHEGQ